MTNGSLEMGIEKINTEKDKFDPKRFCRMCGLRLSQDFNSFGLFIENSAGSGVVNRNIMDLLTILKFNICKNDGLPQQICQSCFETFAVIDEFYNKCLRAQKILLSFKNKTTAEVEDVESVGNQNQSQPDALENDMQMQNENYLKNIFDNAEDLIDELENTSSEYDSTYDAESVADYLFSADIDEDDGDFEYFLKPEMTGNNQNIIDNIAQKSEEIAKNEKELLEENIIQGKIEDTKLCSEHDKKIVKRSSFGTPNSAVSGKPIDNKMENFQKNENQCEICSRIYRSRTLLNVHIRNVHSEKKYWSCPICRKKCFTGIQYNCHMKGHEPSFRSFRCQFCEKSFIKDYHRIKHERTHTNEKSISNKLGEAENKILNDLKVSETDENGMSSVNNSNRNRTLRLSKNGKLNFTTQDCPQTAESLARHDKICSSESESIKVQKNHIQQIQDEKPFSCFICMKSFTRKSSMKRHLLSHPQSDEKPTGKMKRMSRANVVR